MWTRDEPDPLKARRRQLEEQQRRLNERISRLHEELRHGENPAPAKAKPPSRRSGAWRTTRPAPTWPTPASRASATWAASASAT